MRTTFPTAIFTMLLAASAPSFAFAAKEATRDRLRFMADDYPGALARARAQGKPIFLEAWAPW
jgi:hypothetical protein